MTTSEKTTHPYDAGTTRTIIGWLDDGEAPGIVVTGASSQVIASNEVLGSLAAGPLPDDTPRSFAWPGFTGNSTGLAEIAASAGLVLQYTNTDLPRIWAGNLAAHGLKVVGGAVSSEAGTSGVDPFGAVRAFVAPRDAIVRHLDFHSSALVDLADIELTLGSVYSTLRNTLREFVSAYVRDHGTVYYGTDYYAAADESDSMGLAYTDRLGEYPPLAREYENVEVVMGTEDEIEPRRYTDEDHQVWRI